MREDIPEFVANRDSFAGDEESFESRLKGLRDREWKFSSAFKNGYHKGLQTGFIQALQRSLNVAETEAEKLSELTMEERAANFKRVEGETSNARKLTVGGNHFLCLHAYNSPMVAWPFHQQSFQ